MHTRLRLIVRVGSILEEENERGLAHFVEHMVFRGSKHFPAGGVIHKLESLGASFASSVNAYTSFDHTSYKIDLPLHNPSALETALLILNDWAFHAQMNATDIEAERGVILDECHRKDSAHQRAKMRRWKDLSRGSLYENRQPIGLEEVILNASQERILNFYKKWYLPERMAVIVDGDVETKKVEKIIQRIFKNPSTPQKVHHPTFELKEKNSPLFSFHSDKEAAESSFSLIFKTSKQAPSTKLLSIQSIFHEMLQERFFGLQNLENSPFLRIGSLHEEPVQGLSIEKFYASSSQEEEKEALQQLLVEIRKIRTFGFTQEELKRGKENALLELSLKKQDSTFHQTEILSDHFLEKGSFLSLQEEVSSKNQSIPSIQLEDIKTWMDENLSDSHLLIFLSSRSQEIKEKTLKEIYSRSQKEEIFSSVEKEDKTSLPLPQKTQGRIIGSKDYREISMKELTLSNGMKVVIKKTDFVKNQVLIQGRAKGGSTSLNHLERPLVRIAKLINQPLTFQSYDPLEIKKMLSGKQVDMQTSLLKYSRKISGKTTKQDLATSLQMLYLLFTQSEFKNSSFAHSFKKRQIHQLKNQVDPRRIFLSQSPIKAPSSPIKKVSLKDSDLQTVNDIYKKCFSNPSEFTLFIVGDFDSSQIESHIQTFLASIPKREFFLGNPVTRIKKRSFPKGIQSKSIPLSNESISYNQIHIPLNIIEGRYKNHRTNAVAQILKKRLTQTLRREMGGTYHVSVSCKNPYFSKNERVLEIEFSCSPKKSKELIYAALKEVYRLKTHKITEREVDTLKTLQMENLQKHLQKNEYWISTLFKRYRLGLNPEGIYGASIVISSLNEKDLNTVIQQIFPIKSYSTFSSVPK